MPVRDLSQAEAERLSALLDQALDLAPEQRGAWLADLSTRDSDMGAQVKALLASMAEADADRLLETRDLLNRRLGLAVAAPASLEGRLFGPYRVLRLLGQGGMGSVWLAERADGLFSRQVALKLVQQSLMGGAGLSERFARERAILAGLDHPRIARLLDAGVAEDGQPYLAIEYVEGTPLTVYCDAKRLPLPARIDLVVQVLSAVQHAHRNLVVHRDLKPSNILVTPEGQVRLLDFGIAKLMTDGAARETELTQLGGRALTPEYASPEQIAGEPVTTASDVYSLGVLLYELLCGNRPYQLKRDSRGALEEAILTIDPMRPSQSAMTDAIATARSTTAKKLRQTLGGDLDTIVLKALKKNPAERYATADAFMQDLQRYLAHEPVLARPDSAVYRVRKFVWRNKFAAASALAVFVALAAGLGVALWQADKAREQARTAEAVQAFLQDIFRANSNDEANPAKARQTTARELLDIGASKIDSALNDAPDAKLKVLETVAKMYHELTLDDQAVNLHRKRVQLAKSLYGNDDPRVAHALLDLSMSMFGSTSIDERGDVLHEAMGIFDRNRDYTSEARAILLGELAQHYLDKDLAKALEYSRQGVQIFRAYPLSSDLMEALVMQGLVHNQRNEYREAETLFSEAIAVSKATQGETNSRLPRLNAYLAEAQYKRAEFAAAERSYRAALDIARTLKGEGDLDTAQIEQRLASFLFDTSRTREGLDDAEHAKELVLRIKGPDDPWHTPMILEMYGWTLTRWGRLEDGLHYLSLATESTRRHHPESAYMLSALERQASPLIDLGRSAEARALLDEALVIRRKIHDETTNLNGNVLARASLLIAAGRGDDAAQELNAFHMEDAAPGTISRTWLQGSLARAKADLARGKVSDSSAAAAHVREELAHSPSRPYFKTYEAEAALIEGKGRLLAHHPADALPLLTHAVELNSELYDRERSPVLADAQVALADCYLDLGRRDEAKKLLAQAKAIHAAHAELGEHFKAPLRRVAARLAA